MWVFPVGRSVKSLHFSQTSFCLHKNLKNTADLKTFKGGKEWPFIDRQTKINHLKPGAVQRIHLVFIVLGFHLDCRQV